MVGGGWVLVWRGAGEAGVEVAGEAGVPVNSWEGKGKVTFPPPVVC